MAPPAVVARLVVAPIYRIRNGPTPVTGIAEMDRASATLNGTLHPHGTESLAFFEWGTDPALNVFQALAAGTVPAGSVPRSITAVITGLVAGSNCYFRMAGSNPDNAQVQRGSIKSFAVPSALDTWRREHFNTVVNAGIAADLADAEGDGLVNLVEFAFGLNPRLADTHLMPAAVEADGQVILSFTRPPGVSGIVYAAEWSRTLQTGSWLPLPDSGVGATHEFRVPLTPDGNWFIRLKVIMEPSP